MSTVVVRKKDGSLVEFTHEKPLSFCVNRVDGFVTVWVHDSFPNVAQVEGVEAWQKEALVLPSTDCTGYYAYNGEGYENEVYQAVSKFLHPDGEVRFALYKLGSSSMAVCSHKEWLARGFVPVKKVE